jgi:MFS family permease
VDRRPEALASPNPLRYRDHALILAGRFVSQTGTQMQQAAVAWHVWHLTHDVLATASGIGVARAVPILLTALPGGLLADARDRRRLLMATQVMLFLVSAGLAAATLTMPKVPVPLIYATTALWGTIIGLDNPARQSLVANLVPAAALSRAIGQHSAAFHYARVIGPILTGLIVAAFDKAGAPERGLGIIYAIDAASFLVMLGALAALRFRPTAPAEVRPGWAAVAEGWAFVRRQPVVWSTMWLDFFATLLADALLLMPAFAEQVFQRGPTAYTALLAAHGVGALLAGFALSAGPLPRRQGLTVIVSVAVYGAAYAALGFAGAFWTALLLLALAGAADTVSSITRVTLRQALTPDALRGRMNSINMIFFVGGPQLGEAEAGLVAQLLGLRWAIAAGGIACMVVAVFFGLTNRPLRDYAGGPAVPAGVEP